MMIVNIISTDICLDGGGRSSCGRMTDGELSEGRTTLRHLKIPRETECVRSQYNTIGAINVVNENKLIINRSPLLLSNIIIILSS